MWDLIVSVPDRCLSFYFPLHFFFFFLGGGGGGGIHNYQIILYLEINLNKHHQFQFHNKDCLCL